MCVFACVCVCLRFLVCFDVAACFSIQCVSSINMHTHTHTHTHTRALFLSHVCRWRFRPLVMRCRSSPTRTLMPSSGSSARSQPSLLQRSMSSRTVCQCAFERVCVRACMRACVRLCACDDSGHLAAAFLFLLLLLLLLLFTKRYPRFFNTVLTPRSNTAPLPRTPSPPPHLLLCSWSPHGTTFVSSANRCFPPHHC